jgi:hypothetical protein
MWKWMPQNSWWGHTCRTVIERVAGKRRLPWPSRLGVGREVLTMTSLKLNCFETPAKDLKMGWIITL